MTSGRSGELKSPLKLLSTGVLIGFGNLTRAIAVVSLVFVGAASSGASLALQIFLVSALMTTFALNYGKALPSPTFSIVHSGPIAAFFPAIMIVDAHSGTLGIFIFFGLTCILSGLAMLLMGFFNLGKLVRMIPYAVTTGFLAASGALLIKAALDLVTSGNPGLLPWQFMTASPDVILPSLTFLFAAVMFACARIHPRFGVAIGLLVGIAGTHIAMTVMGVSVDTARDLGLMHEPLQAMEVPSLAAITAILGSVDASLLLAVLPLSGAAVLIGLFGTVLNSNAVELVLNRDLNLRTVLIRTGAVNILTGAFGSSPSYVMSSSTQEAKAAAPADRDAEYLSVIGMCLVFLLAIPASDFIFFMIPKYLSAGMLLFLGGKILNDWLFQQFGKLRPTDWALNATIVLMSLLFGVVAAIGFGIIAAIIIFAILYARLPVIRNTTDLATRRSNVDRGPAQTAILDDRGHEVAIISLQGFLFFGTSAQITKQIRYLLDGPQPPRCIVLDFKHVSQLDASAIATLHRMAVFATSSGCRLILAQINPAIHQELTRNAFSTDTASGHDVIESVDHALEMMEDFLIADLQPVQGAETAFSALAQICDSADLAGRLIKAMQCEEIAQGTKIITQGDISEDIFILDQGRLAVIFQHEDGGSYRVRSLEAGALVGEIASYAGLPRTADVMAETDVVLYRISPRLLQDLGNTDAILASALHRAIAKTLAGKLNRTNKLLRDNL